MCLPFVIGAPHAFVHEVLVDQLRRGPSAVNAFPTGFRLVAITGLIGIPALPQSATLAIGLLGALGLLVVVAYGLGYQEARRVDLYVLVATLASTTAIVEAPGFYSYYAYFPAPFLAALLAVTVTGTAAAVRRKLADWPIDQKLVRVASALVLVCGAGLLALAVVEDTSYTSSYLPDAVLGPGYIVEPAAAIDSVIPPGSCVISDHAILAIVANRFSSSVPGCPQVVDPYGMWLAQGGGLSPPASPPFPASFVSTWRSYFESAQYVVLWVRESDSIPWNSSLLNWFDTHYRLIQIGTGSYVYFHSSGAS
jgi:hypothetical protein